MSATVFAAKTAFQQILFGKNIKTIFNVVFTHIQKFFFQFIQTFTAKAICIF